MRGYMIGTIVLLAGLSSSSQTAERRHRIVFEVDTSVGTFNWTLDNVDDVRSVLGSGDTTVELVAHGAGLDFLTSRGLPEPLQIRMKTMAKEGVIFSACESSMKAAGIKRQDLLPFVKTVDSAIAEIVRKQEAGWSYIKAGAGH